MARTAYYITTWLIRCNAIKENDRSLYEYAICSLSLTICPLLMVIFNGFIMGLVKESILFILPFMVIRKYSGGFHMKHAWTCFVCSYVVLFLCIFITARVQCSILLSVLVLGSAASLIVCSPVDSEKRQLDLTEKQSYKKTTIWISVLFLAIYEILILFELGHYSKWIGVGLILPAVSQMPVIIKKLADKHRRRD